MIDDDEGWISVKDQLPISLEEAENGLIGSVDVLVSDGNVVGTSCCMSGYIPNPWVEFSAYGDIEPKYITHWKPYPKPPTKSD